MLKVKQVFDNSGQHFGAEEIRIILAEAGLHVGKKRGRAVMREMGPCSIRTDAKKQFKRKQQCAKQNLLKRSFSADHPDQIRVSDITYFQGKGYWVYLCIIFGSIFPQSYRLAGIEAYEYTSGHCSLQGHISGTGTAAELDFSQ